MRDPDRWLRLGVHWHAYVEIDDGDSFATVSTRDDRLRMVPTTVLMTPEDVCEWVAAMTRKHAHPETVHLIGRTNSGKESWGCIGDEGHVAHDFADNLEVASKGESLYYHFRRETDRMRLWTEAVIECREAHHDER
ncbi:hypothetical protein [Saccharopolyspora endophytica]|uniref:Uncharacterized protein n=1 Tax=Saccharopolyspora endophytica TaxID=543886 RepID=A0ABS5DQJ4_9PSEU|nr:hypothetical protein [Saccharopolyspora endophytica]MBQ0928569.1 hypothetical protein [Saccharopolyspora endophytica]